MSSMSDGKIDVMAALAQMDKGIESGNINIDSIDGPALGLSESAKASQTRQAELLAQVDAMRRARTIVVPTNDSTVRQKLRELGHPITLFGERAPGRRERLRSIMSRLATEQRSLLDANLGPAMRGMSGETADGTPREKKPVMYEGSGEISRVRKRVFDFSIAKAKKRVGLQRRKRENPQPGEEETEVRKIQETERRFKKYAALSSTIGDTRTISSVGWQATNDKIVTGSWSGYCKVWDVAEGTELLTLQNHEDSRVSDVAFHPRSGLGLDAAAANVASCDVDGNVYLWPLQAAESKAMVDDGDAPKKVPLVKAIAKLEGHKDRCARLAFHPSGELLATTSYDRTWMLWDLEKQASVIKQRGHSRAVYGLAMQGDGALLSTADLGGNCRIWDIRSGKSVMPLRGGHSKQVFCMDFAPNGFHLATGSEDNTVRVWDLRKRQCLYTIPAHSSLVSSVCWQPDHGTYLISSGYDNTAKVWSASDFQLLRTFAGHEGRVTRAAISPDAATVVTTSFDRTWKSWSYENCEDELLL